MHLHWPASRAHRSFAAVLLAAASMVLLPGVAHADALDDAVADATPARRPFAGMTVARIRVGGETLRVVVADDNDERIQGLRERATIGRYDGMLFVFPGGIETAFTMSTVPVPLQIGFYDDRGRVVDRLRMESCPESEADCPLYEAGGSFTYALETLVGDLPKGRLRAAPK